jgi:outer membrane protein OmpA-like peptidoglycan-associated protein
MNIDHRIQALALGCAGLLLTFGALMTTVEAEPVMTTPAPATRTVSFKSGTLFNVNSANLKPAGESELTALSNQLKAMHEIQNIKIVGHTDSSGAVDYNQQLSERRAIAVKNFLLDQGIPASTLSTLGMGESSPVGNNGTRQGRALNRRVDITIMGTDVAAP